MTGVTRYSYSLSSVVRKGQDGSTITSFMVSTADCWDKLLKASKPAKTLKAAKKNAMRLGTAHFCCIGSRIGRHDGSQHYRQEEC